MEKQIMRRDKILIIHPSLSTGGAEKIMAFLANILADKYRVQMMLLKKNEVTLPIDEKVEVIVKESYSELPIIGKRLLAGLKALGYMTTCIQNQINLFKPNLVICFDLRVLLATSKALKKKKDMILFSERADPYENTKYWQHILKYLYRKLGFIVFQTSGAQQFYGEKIKEKSCVILNPALSRDLCFKQEIGIKRENYIFAAGRFQYRKGFDLLISAFAKVASISPDTKLMIFGSGDEEATLRRRIEELSLRDRITIEPPIPGVVEKNKAARLFVLPSRSEGIPNILIEAMLARIPTVSADCSPGGARLLTSDGELGLLAKNDSIESLAEKMEYALRNPQEMEKMAIKAAESMKKYEPEKIAEEWKDVIEKQISEKKQK